MKINKIVVLIMIVTGLFFVLVPVQKRDVYEPVIVENSENPAIDPIGNTPEMKPVKTAWLFGIPKKWRYVESENNILYYTADLVRHDYQKLLFDLSSGMIIGLMAGLTYKVIAEQRKKR